MKKYFASKPGFTIVEIIIVTIVITILAAIVIVGYGSWRSTIAKKAIQSDLSMAATAMEAAHNANNDYPTSLPTNFKASSDVTVAYSYGSTTGYCLQATSVKYPSLIYNIKNTTKTPNAGNCGGCTSGDTLSGGNCIHTYAASYQAAISPYYYCPSGGTLSGTTCNTTGSYGASYSPGTSGYYYCPNTANGEVLQGTTCVATIPNSSYPSTYNPMTFQRECLSGGVLVMVTCYVYSSYPAFYQAGTSGYYYCPSGGTLSGTTCNTTGSYGASYNAGSSAYYYCNGGDTLSVTTCTNTYPPS